MLDSSGPPAPPEGRSDDRSEANPTLQADDYFSLAYNELRSLARARLSRLTPGQTMQPTALVHETYLRLTGSRRQDWTDPHRFLADAARAMRDIMVEEARRKTSLKRGGGRDRVILDDAAATLVPPSADVLAVDEAVTRLETIDPLKARIVNLRYFAQLTVEETARALGLSLVAVRRECRFVLAWLEREIQGRS